MLLLDLIEWSYEHWGELSLSALLLFVLRKFIMSEVHKLLHFGRDEELAWTRRKVEELTGEKWSGPQPFWNRVRIHYTKRYYSSSRKATNLEYQLRRIPMLKLLTTSAGRKIVYLLLATAVTFVNNKFGLNLNQDTIFSVWGGALALMQLEAHFNMKQFISSAINALSGAAQSATTTTSGTPIQTVTAPPMTQQEATEMLKELSGYLQPVYDSVSSGKMTDSTVKALQAAMAIRDYLKQYKGA